MINLDLNKKYLLACSYGPDSMALFDMLFKSNIIFEAALVNYNLREESKVEMESFISYCKEKKIKCYVKSVEGKNFKGNIEENCRKIRYLWFKELTNENGFDGVLVAHHLDDLLETYFLQKKRKNQVEYLGIKEKNIIFGIEIIRPLLSYEKKELEDYCIKNKVPYMIDKSNFSNDFKRNQIRHEIIDKMSKDEKLLLLKKIENENSELAKIIADINVYKLNNIQYLKSLDLISLQFALNRMIKNIDNSLSISKRFTSEILKMLSSSKTVICMPIKNNIYAIKDYSGFYFFDKSPISYCFKLETPSKLDTKYFFLDFSDEFKNRNISNDDFPITIRNVNENDMISFKCYSRNVKKLFVDWKMPISRRLTWPIIVNKEGIIVYIPRYKKDLKFKQNLNFWVK